MSNLPEKSAADLVEFDLVREMADAEQKKPWPSGRYTQTLLKRPDMRILLISLEKGAALKEHHADGAISVQVLKGSIRFAAQGDSRTMKTGSVVSLGAAIKHAVEALEDSAFLLTISWPEASRLEAMPHRGYEKQEKNP